MNNWILCKDQLPERNQDVLFCELNFVAEGCFTKDGEWLQYKWNQIRNRDAVIAWMPLPAPYKERNS